MLWICSQTALQLHQQRRRRPDHAAVAVPPLRRQRLRPARGRAQHAQRAIHQRPQRADREAEASAEEHTAGDAVVAAAAAAISKLLLLLLMLLRPYHWALKPLLNLVLSDRNRFVFIMLHPQLLKQQRYIAQRIQELQQRGSDPQAALDAADAFSGEQERWSPY